MKETIIKTASESTKTLEAKAHPSNRIEPIIDNLIYNQIKIINQALADKKQTKIQGILTSNLRTGKSTNTPYMAFFRLATSDFANHSLEQCAKAKCQDCEIQVVFRITNAFQLGICWSKPKLSKGDSVILTGKWANGKGSKRPSFTCYSYQLVK